MGFNMELEIISNSYDRPFGVPRYNHALVENLRKAGIDYSLVRPFLPIPFRMVQPALNKMGIDLRTVFTNYPVAANLSRHSVKHLTNHTLATLIPIRNLENTVVTVHDIKPDWLILGGILPGYRFLAYQLLHKLALVGLRKADRLITDTVHVKEQLVKNVGVFPDAISVIPLGVDHTIFYPQIPTDDFLKRYELCRDNDYILHVGTDAPRKNLPGIIEAFANVRQRLPKLNLIKAGSTGWADVTSKVKELIRKYDLGQHIHFCSAVSDKDLAMLYCSATVLVYPSFYEGFGLPVIEAMACGTPVITSNTSCLPEITGNAALLVNPYDVNELTESIFHVVTDRQAKELLSYKGLLHAKQFCWQHTVQETIRVYNTFIK